jgi:hypothetical protein
LSSLALLAVAFFSAPALAAEDGAKIFKDQCSRCHGPGGKGTKRFKKQLQGDLSVAQLSALVHKTMPEDGPGSLSKAEADAVAAYIHGAFYSRLARERDKPARVALARLTVAQYRNAVSDLVGSFRWQPKYDDQRGLKAEYYKQRNLNPRNRVLQRTDANVDFNFKAESPVPGKIEAHEFSIRWAGSLLVPDTGEHEFTVRTEHAARLWLNDMKAPLIDAWVKSGKDSEYKPTIFLVAGRAYPLRLEYTKAKQGVNDSKTGKKPKSVPSSIALLWKRPHQAREAVPSRHLSPNPAPESYVCSTPFPPDDRSFGWERGTTVSKEWDQATTDAALDTAGYVAKKIDDLCGARGDAAKAKAFCLTFAERAFRRPLSADQKAIIEKQFAKGPLEISIKRAVLLTLKSPHFLYREAGPSAGAYDTAARLSFSLWGSIPGRELLEAATKGNLKTPEQVRKQAERMLADPRAKARLHAFLLTWLKADLPHDLAKDPKLFPGFGPEVVSDLRTSLHLFLDNVVWSESSDFRQLLLSEEVPLNGRLAKFYGAELPEGADFKGVKLDAGKRAGVLTHPYLMTSFAYSADSSPIHRGVFVARGLLGVAIKTPPVAVAPVAPDLHPALTTRERVILQTKPATCMTCHAVINPLGFPLENFDAVGRFREKDRGKPVDTKGGYQTRAGKTAPVTGPRELAAFLADSPEAHAAFVEQMFEFLVQQSPRAYGPDTVQRLRKSFVANRFHVRKLAVEILTISALPPKLVKR